MAGAVCGGRGGDGGVGRWAGGGYRSRRAVLDKSSLSALRQAQAEGGARIMGRSNPCNCYAELDSGLGLSLSRASAAEVSHSNVTFRAILKRG